MYQSIIALIDNNRIFDYLCSRKLLVSIIWLTARKTNVHPASSDREYHRLSLSRMKWRIDRRNPTCVRSQWVDSTPPMMDVISRHFEIPSRPHSSLCSDLNPCSRRSDWLSWLLYRSFSTALQVQEKLQECHSNELVIHEFCVRCPFTVKH